MFKVTATHHVLAVNDLEKIESYFLEKLGFSIRFHVDGWSFLSLGRFHVMLGQTLVCLSAFDYFTSPPHLGQPTATCPVVG